MRSAHNLTSDQIDFYPSSEDSAARGVLIMDACPITALGIRHILTHSCGIIEPVNHVPNLASITSGIASAPPALLIMDICGEKELMLDGLRQLAHLNDAYPLMKIIICTDYCDHRILELLANSNANGILLKHEPVLALSQCVSEVMAGAQRWLSPKARLLLADMPLCSTPLTARELDVLVYLFSGQSVSRVAQTLHRNIRTVSTHKRNAMVKLGFHNNSELFTQGTWMAQKGPVASL